MADSGPITFDTTVTAQPELIDEASCPGQDEASPLTVATPLGRFGSIFGQRVASNKSLLSIFDQAVVSGTAFLSAAIIGRTTSASQLGQYYIVLSIVMVILGIQDQLVTAPYIVYSKQRKGRELAEYAGSIWMHHLILTALIVVGLFIAIEIFEKASHSAIVPGLWALLGAVPFLMLRNGVRRYSYANLKVNQVIPLDIIVAVLQLGGLGALAYFDRLSLTRIYAVMGGACCLACVGWYLLDRPQVQLVRPRIATDWRVNWGFGRWALKSFLVGNLTPYATLWILTVSAGAAATGILGACTTIVGLTNVVLTGVANVLTAQAADAYVSGGAHELRRILMRAAALLGSLIGAFCLFVLLTGDLLTVLTFGTAFQGTGLILFALALSALMTSISTVVGNGLWAIDKPHLNFVADVCCLTLTLLGAAVLIAPLGALGAALAILAGTLTSAVVRTVTLFRQLKSSDSEASTPATTTSLSQEAIG